MRKTDVSAAARIVGRNYSREYQAASAKEFRAMFGRGPCRPTYFVAEECGAVVGVAGYAPSWMDYGICEIFWVNVAPERQGHGIGAELVGRVIQAIRKAPGASLALLTADASKRLPDYYAERFGFRPMPASSDGYRLMCLELRRFRPAVSDTASK